MASRESTSSSSSSSSKTTRTQRTSIHTPLKPASVQDLKAKFDSSKSGNGSGSSGGTTPRSPLSDRKNDQRSSFGKGGVKSSSSSISGGGGGGGGGVTLSSVSSALQSAAQRRMETGGNATAASSLSLSSSSSSSTSSSSSSSSVTKTTSKISLTTPRPYCPSSNNTTTTTSKTTSSSSSSLPSSAKSTTTNTFNSSNFKSTNKSSSLSKTGVGSRTDEIRSSFEKDSEGRIELPVMHITGSGSDVKVVTTSSKTSPRGSNIADNRFRKSDDNNAAVKSNNSKKEDSRNGPGPKLGNVKSNFDGSGGGGGGGSPKASPRGLKSTEKKAESPPVQRTNRLIAREITIERLDSGVCVTSYKDQQNPPPTMKSPSSSSASVKTLSSGNSNTSSTTVGSNRVGEVKILNVTTTSSSTDPSSDKKSPKEDLPFRQVKLRNTKEQIERQSSKDKLTTTTNNTNTSSSNNKLSDLRPPSDDLDKKRISRRMSNERFERLKFDFERGVPTEYSPRTDSGDSDHIVLQQKARELRVKSEDGDDVPIIVKATKEESIFTEGLKVSDFVKQVNKMNPESDSKPKWKAVVQKRPSLQATSSGGGDGADCYYEGIPGEDVDDTTMVDYDDDDEDDIYEQVSARPAEPAVPEPEQDGVDTGKTPGRRLGVYRKQKGGKKRQQEIVSQSKPVEDSDQEVVIHSDGENGWEEDGGGGGSSSGTDYEDVGQDVYDDGGEETYEDLEAFSKEAGRGGGNPKTKTLTHKLKKIFVNSKGQKDKKKKSKAPVEAGKVRKPTLLRPKPSTRRHHLVTAVVVATDSEGEILDDTDEAESEAIETLSRTSSERSSGRFVRNDSGTSSHNNHQNIAAASDVATANSHHHHHHNNKDNNSSSNTSTTTMSSTSHHNPIIITESSSDDLPPSVPPPPPPSLPPHSSSSSSSSSSSTSSSSQNQQPGPPPPPPLPPRSSRNLTQLAENSPPLPPRNATLSGKTTLGISLDTVVPVSPPANKRNSHYAGDKKKDRFSFNSQDGSDSGCSTGKLEYIDYDPASAQTIERNEKADRRSAAPSSSSRPSSSASTASSVYMYPDMSAFPELQAQDGDDSLYVDLEDEQIYGKASDIYVSKFESEPLYQWYSKDKMIQNIRSNKGLSSGDLSDEEYLELEKDSSDANSVYEDVERLLEKNTSVTHGKPPGSGSSSSNISNSSQEELRNKEPLTIDRPQRRSIIEDVFKNGGSLHRALWCQMPEVMKSGLLQELTDQEKKIQEAMFEIMTSEASYLKSLKILINVFVSAPEFAADHSDRCVITRRDRTILFSNIGSIKDISSNFLSDLESRWQESIVQKDVCDIIIKHATKNFEPYVRYCRNQAFQDRALNTLKQNSEFSDAVKRLEQNPNCQFLPLASFLLLPMQRITRLPLLVDAICHRLDPGTPQHSSARKAFESLTKVAKHCDEAAKKIQQAEQMCLLASNLEFKIKEFPIVSASRFLVKQGELTLIKGEGTSRKPLSKLLGSNKEHVYLFLFNDLLLLTKKKGHTYSVRDYCQRNSLHVEAIDNPDKSRHIAQGTATGMANLLFLAMLANHDSKQVELVLACKSESERSRWIDAIMPTQSNSDMERIYDVWDCPQLQCVRKYLATQPDELTLEESDVVNVTKKLADGWCMGERIRDGEKGWFPASYTEEINNSHVRARNLRLRYRLMMASEEYAQMELVKDKR